MQRALHSHPNYPKLRCAAPEKLTMNRRSSDLQASKALTEMEKRYVEQLPTLHRGNTSLSRCGARPRT
jgi:hypothetical protein